MTFTMETVTIFDFQTRSTSVYLRESLIDFLKVTVNSISSRGREARQRARAHGLHTLEFIAFYGSFFFWDKRICCGARHISRSRLTIFVVLHGRFYVIERINLMRPRCTNIVLYETADRSRSRCDASLTRV